MPHQPFCYSVVSFWALGAADEVACFKIDFIVIQVGGGQQIRRQLPLKKSSITHSSQEGRTYHRHMDGVRPSVEAKGTREKYGQEPLLCHVLAAMEDTGGGGGDLSNCTRLVAQGLFLVAKCLALA